MSGIPAGAGSLIGKRLGKYEILALLALGGTAEIYLARIDGAAGFEKYVVVKCLHDHLNDDQDFVKMFLDEARIAAHLDHSNIVQTMELGEQDGRYFMVMEFLAGLSLAMVVRRVAERIPGGKVPASLTLNMLAQSCAGLHYAHERSVNGKNLNIVHRDISPQNIVVSFEGVAKVVDFGIAKADQRETKTRTGTIKGKFAYMSPEQCVAQNVDRRTDIFALGVIAHELLTGKRLFKRPSPYETYQAVIDCAVPLPSSLNHELDPSLDAVIMKALAKEKEGRYPTAEAFGDALLGYLHHRGKGSGPGDVARFFEQSFMPEIEEHGARMRDLIAGREAAALEVAMSWGSDDDGKRIETLDLQAETGDKSLELGTQDLMRQSQSSLSDVISGLGVKTGDRSATDDDDDDDDGDEDDMPADRTRIEANPLEKLAEMDKSAAQKPAAKAIPSVVRPATVAAKPSSIAVPKLVTPAPTRVEAPRPKMPPSGPLPLPPVPPSPQPGKFPELANLPTMIAELDETSDVKEPPPPELQRTALAAAPINPGDPRANYAALAPTRPPIETFESAAPTQEVGSYEQQYAQHQARQAYEQQHQMQQPQPQYGQGSGPYGQQPQVDSGVFLTGPNPQLMSPVGAQYPNAVDWAAEAARPVRVLPPWMLGVVFAGAIGLALTITIIIARLAR